jgi:predicted RecA/RadA family phage recombinase
MTAAIREGDTIRISDNLAHALAGIPAGYRVNLHALPRYTFEIAAASMDAAIAAAVALCKREGINLPTNAATCQRFLAN